jgi:CelD/BcsL family acetyltransferase involved in cellulose biosynthesis
MHFQVIQTLPEMEALAEEWNILLSHSASHVPFLRNEYLTAWWKTMGGGEWKQGELFVVTARSDTGGELIGIAPLFFTQNLEGQPALMLLGSIEISDYLDVIAPEDSLKAFLGELVDFLIHLPEPAWQVLDWYNILEESPTLPALAEVARQKGCEYQQEPLKHCPYIPLPSDWETYLAGIDKKQRHEIRRKLRRAEMNGSPVSWYIVEDRSELDADIEAFLNLMATDPEKERFLTAEMRSQMRQTITNAFEAGWLQLSFLTVGQEKIAAYLNFDFENQIWVYNSGFDPRFRELSSGWVLLSYLIKWAIEHHRECFDFLRGDEEYKYRFGGQDRRVMRAILHRR